jgi:hypothetical protein
MSYDHGSMEHDGYTRGVAFTSVGGLQMLQVASQLTIVAIRFRLESCLYLTSDTNNIFHIVPI